MMMLGAMDHTPSEQLTDPDQWHTTVLIMSASGEHWNALPKDLASRMKLPDLSLKKWAGGRSKQRYKKVFQEEFFNCLPEYPVHVRVVSAQASIIKAVFPTILNDLGLTTFVRSTSDNNKAYIEFGPFLRSAAFGEKYEPWKCKIREHQAIPLLFICYFLLRAHRDFLLLVQQDQPDVDWFDLQLMHNKFPGDVAGPMGSLFGALMNLTARAGLVSGNIMTGTFNDARTDLGNLLADNIAGYFSDKIVAGNREVPAPTPRARGASLFWEIWA